MKVKVVKVPSMVALYTIPRPPRQLLYPVQSSRGPPRGILPRISHFSQNRGSDCNTGGFLLPSTSGRGGHKKRWPVSEPLQLFRESLPLPCFPCASFLFKSDLYSPSIAGSASKAAPLPSLAVAFSSCSPVRRRAFGVFQRESLSWGAGKGRGSLFILTGISLISSFIEYI